MAPLTVEIWSDVVCPWCDIGEQRFDAALAQFPHEVEHTWRSFELDPSAPPTREHGATEHLAAKYGMSLDQAREAKERLMRAYFTEGVAIGDRDALVELAADIGLDPDEARAVLDGDAYADAVRDDETLAHRIGIHAVPFFVLDRRYGVSSAQPAEILVQALEKACA
jgi:predicted DsbA family dithiol-disulfide isomerase